MSDIRFNTWLHQSGTGGITQVDGGHVGIGTTNPDIAVHTANAKKVNVGIVTANSIYASNFYGNGSNLTGLASDKIIEGDTKVEVVDSGSQYISAEVNGSEKIRITSDGQLIVGATAATNGSIAEFSKSVGGGAGGCHVTVENTSTNSVNNTAGIHLKTDQGVAKFFTYRAAETYLQSRAGGASDLLLQANGASNMRFFTNGNETLRINSDGDLSLGKGSAANASYGRNFQIHHNGTSGAALQLTDNNTGSGGGDGFHIISTSQIAYLWQRENANMVFGTQGIARWNMYGSNGHFAPHADSTYDIGTNTVRVRNIYADNLYGSGANLTSLPSSTPPENLLINGAMQVNVRGTNHQTLGSFNPVTSSIYTLDRWKVLNENSFDTDSAKVVQDTGAPTSEGFRKSIMMNIGNTETPSSTQVCGFQQMIEAQNLQHLCYGTSSAKTMTLTFWVYSNKTGTYCVQLTQHDPSKFVLYEYTISSSNTWEKKTITIAGNTADAINNDNGIGFKVNWILCCGSARHNAAVSSWTSGANAYATSNQVNLWDHADNYFKMTGCQLQVGAATDFIHEDISTTLRKCQRYFYMAAGPYRYETLGTGMIYYSGTGYANIYFPTTMRTQPSLVALSGSSGGYVYQTLLSNTAAYTHQIGMDTNKTSLNGATLEAACPSSRNGEAFRLSAHFSHDANNGQSFVNFDAEL